jgi:hypothetical protein
VLNGFAPDGPIPCDGPRGEKGYIEALRCPSGAEYDYHRTRPIPIVSSEQKVLIVDEYSLTCKCPHQHSRKLYFDMYRSQLMRKLRGR